MTRDELQKRIRAEIINQVGIETQMEGTRKFHDAAVLVGNNSLAQNYRDNLHTLLDAKLDSAASVMLLTRQLTELPE
jgi:hypothetical protein